MERRISPMTQTVCYWHDRIEERYPTLPARRERSFGAGRCQFANRGTRVCCCYGRVGIGKSTFLHLIGGLDKPDAGEVLVNGLALQSASEKELTISSARPGNCLPVLQPASDSQRVGKRLSAVTVSRGQTSRGVTRAREMLGLVGMENRAHHFVHQLSGGEMQRTAIARALVHRPKLLLADEPTGNLDGANAEKVLKIFRRVADEQLTTLVVITHSIEVAEIAQRRIHLRDGKLAARWERCGER